MGQISAKLSSVFALIIIVILMSGGQACTSKRLAKQAQKLEDAGMYELAAENYLRSFNANPKNIEAATGLRRTSQRTLDSKAAAVTQAYISGNDRQTVYSWLDALAYQERIRKTGIEISMPPQARSSYEEAKPRFLDRSFEEARLLLEEESFNQAESIFSEIKRIDPTYQDLDQYMRISRSEPLYRQGADQLNSGFYRRAYHTFSNLLNNHGAYKDAKELREDALSMGMLTIAIADFENNSRIRDAHVIVKNRITAEISNLNNPFVRIVDDRNIEAFLKEQELAARLGSDMKIGQLMAARALLTGNLLSFEITEGRVSRNEKRGFIKEVVTSENKDTGEKSTQTLYHKVTYNEYNQESRARGTFQFQLSSTETGAVLIADVIDLRPSDRIHYAVFDGNKENLVPGHWEYKDRNSPKDNIEDNTRSVRALRNLLEARQTIKTGDMLRSELTDGIALAVSRTVDAFNPEE